MENGISLRKKNEKFFFEVNDLNIISNDLIYKYYYSNDGICPISNFQKKENNSCYNDYCYNYYDGNNYYVVCKNKKDKEIINNINFNKNNSLFKVTSKNKPYNINDIDYFNKKEIINMYYNKNIEIKTNTDEILKNEKFYFIGIKQERKNKIQYYINNNNICPVNNNVFKKEECPINICTNVIKNNKIDFICNNNLNINNFDTINKINKKSIKYKKTPFIFAEKIDKINIKHESSSFILEDNPKYKIIYLNELSCNNLSSSTLDYIKANCLFYKKKYYNYFSFEEGQTDHDLSIIPDLFEELRSK